MQQAQSDLAAYEVLALSSLPSCHRLHYLQIWLEKLCKAYSWSAATGRADNPPDYERTHNIVAKVLPPMIRAHWENIGSDSPPDFQEIRALCREIDLLHPQVDADGKRPDNVEYPWAAMRDGHPQIVAPATESFRLNERLHQNVGRKLMKAAIVLTRQPTLWSATATTGN